MGSSPVGRRYQWTNYWKHETFSEYVAYAYDVDAMLCPLHWVRLRYARVSELYTAAIRSQGTENDNLFLHLLALLLIPTREIRPIPAQDKTLPKTCLSTL
jgi:hypothetical protein